MRAEEEASTRQLVVETYRKLKREGLIYGSAGNVSTRMGDLVWITPSGIEPEMLEAEHICVVGLDGTGYSAAEGVVPSSEVPLHLEIYRSTGARAVVHGHSSHAVTAGLVVDEVPNIHYVMRRLGGTLRVAPYELFGSQELAARVLEALTDRSAALMRNHGAVAYGENLAESLESYRCLEWVCEVYLRARAVGAPAALEAHQLDSVAQAAETRGYRL